MKILENFVEEYVQDPGVDGAFKAVRDAAAICYQTDVDKMKLSPYDFVMDVLLKNGHTRPLEFGTVYLKIPMVLSEVREYCGIYSRVASNHIRRETYVITNMRVLAQGGYESDREAFENGYDRNFFDDLKYWCDPVEVAEYVEDDRRSFKIVCSRGAGDDMRTHITLSSMMESTRYCNYSKSKFGGELSFIRPYWIDRSTIYKYFGPSCLDVHPIDDPIRDDFFFLNMMQREEDAYLDASTSGLQAQQLKRIYPLGAKVELRLCGFDSAWQNFFWRRCDSHADPECKIIADKIREIY